MPHNETQRRCILSGETGARTALIRLALSPGGEVLPDIGARAPGRGAWLGVDQETLRKAQASGKLRGALGRAFKGGARHVPADLAASVAAELERRTLDLLGLTVKAGQLVFGSDRIKNAVQAGRVYLLLHAADSAPSGRGKLDAVLHSTRPEAKSRLLPVSRERLSLALGAGNVVHAAVTDSGAAARIGAALARWRAFLGLEEWDGAGQRARAEEGI